MELNLSQQAFVSLYPHRVWQHSLALTLLSVDQDMGNENINVKITFMILVSAIERWLSYHPQVWIWIQASASHGGLLGEIPGP